jgi:hypothetical protein
VGATCIKIDLGRLRDRLSAELARDLSLSDVHVWLKARGFKLRGHWHCDGDSIRHLRRDEILHTWTTETRDHVTYVESRPAEPPEPPELPAR